MTERNYVIMAGEQVASVSKTPPTRLPLGYYWVMVMAANRKEAKERARAQIESEKGKRVLA